jgi:transaldolase
MTPEAAMTIIHDIRKLGQSIWLDNLSRTHLREGVLAHLIEQGVAGITSNPSIFQKAVAESPYYRDDLAAMLGSEPQLERRYEALVIADIQAACDLLRPTYDASDGDNGYVSLEVSPRLAHDENGTVVEALRLRDQVERDNLLIKVPATPAGIKAFARLTATGVRVNVTLLFSVPQTAAVFEAYLRGAREWLTQGGDPRRLKAVASLFLSRVDTLVDKRLEAIGTPEALGLRGQSAVAMAKLAYRRYQEIFHGPAFAELRAAGVRPQYLLWASSGTKNPAYSDLLYVEPLIGPETINTLPDKTLAALLDHGRAELRVEASVAEANEHGAALAHFGIDLAQIGDELQEDGVRLFAEAFDALIKSVA